MIFLKIKNHSVLFFTVLAIVNLLSCFGTDEYRPRYLIIIGGIISALICGILILGAATRNATAIIVWIVFAVIQNIISAVLAILLLAKVGTKVGAGGVVVVAIFLIAAFIFQIWVIYVAKKAIDEIREGQ